MEIDTVIIAQREPTPISTAIHEHCPAGCDLADATRCWLHHEREIRADLMAARASNSPDAEVLVSDLRAAEERTDRLLILALGWVA
jgi:hypothetical protein